MTLVGWILVGLLAGGVGRRLAGADQRGCLGTMAIGLIGAFVGGAVYRAVRGPEVELYERVDVPSLLVATLGATGFLLGLAAIAGRGGRGRRGGGRPRR